jgi:diguanylate cyclase (GGDEF)-like protein
LGIIFDLEMLKPANDAYGHTIGDKMIKELSKFLSIYIKNPSRANRFINGYVMNLISKDSFLKIVNHLHDGLYVVDNNRVITFWNQEAEKISGFSASIGPTMVREDYTRDRLLKRADALLYESKRTGRDCLTIV